jgi:spermidine synthase
MDDGVLFEAETEFGQYMVIDTIYSGRPARVLYSGHHKAAQSGIAYDDNTDLLFDYNQRFIELIRGLQPDKVLLIGGGTLSLPIALLDERPDVNLEVVDIDEKLYEISERFFNFKPGKNTKLHVAEGRSFLANNKTKYDMIIIDAFINTDIPPGLQTVEAAQSYAAHLRKDGVVVINVIAAYHGRRSAVLQRQVAAFEQAFSKVSIFPASRSLSLWIPQNFVVTAQNSQLDLEQYIRFSPMRLPDLGADAATND